MLGTPSKQGLDFSPCGKTNRDIYHKVINKSTRLDSSTLSNTICRQFSVYMFFFSISMTAISMMRLRFCQNEFAKSSYLPKYKNYEETNSTVIKGFQNQAF